MTTSTEELPPAMTVQRAAKHLGISRNLCYEGVARGEIPSIRVGGKILIPRAKLLALLGEKLDEDDST